MPMSSDFHASVIYEHPYPDLASQSLKTLGNQQNLIFEPVNP